jgi:DNA repair protein RadA
LSDTEFGPFEKDDTGMETCPVCSKKLKSASAHLRRSLECREGYEAMSGEAAVVTGVIESAPVPAPANAPESAPEPPVEQQPIIAPVPIKKHIKYVAELPLRDIPGVGAKTEESIKAWLKAKEFVLVQQLSAINLADFNMKGLDEKIKIKLIDMARRECGYYYMVPASEIPVDYDVISTGIPVVDEILGGGFRTGESYELYGGFGSGKTQWLVYMYVRSQLEKSKGGLYDPNDPDGPPQCLWLDTEKTINGIIAIDQRTKTSRLMEVARAVYEKEYPRTENEPVNIYDQKVIEFIRRVYKNVLINNIESSEDQVFLIKNIMKDIANYKNIRIIALDSLIALFRAEYGGRGQLSDRQQTLNRHIHDFQKLAGKDAVLIVTNQVQSNPDGMSYVPAEFNVKATGGNIVAHNFNIRIYLKRGKAGSKVMEIVDSSYLPNKDANYTITSKGIEPLGE